ncbi:hypothetical protein AZE42_07443 [Rhizopogon vesiculosus]|uniref:Uncharacterized protein n=1 Tax=Rhizopogon vesiculosus TaxID=180088 RepID=A0A1J8QHA7_9AGAM|nr:hypothetical protein AZE42_07443 [Rhizopogon vesiculosus]
MSNETMNGRFLSPSSSVDSDTLKPAIRAYTMSTTSHINTKSKTKATPMRPLRMTAYRDDSHEITNVPDPVPDTGVPPPSGDTIYFTPPPITASPEEYHAASLKSTSATPVSTFISLQPLLSAAPTPTAENVHAIGITTVLSPASSTPPAQVQSPAPSHLVSKTPAIALSVLGGVVLLGIVIAIRIARRPRRRRKCPTPSLPILQDAAFPGQFESQGSESPIFGGKERFSPSLRGARNTGLWTWTQYHSGLQKPAPIITVTKSTSGKSVKGSGSEESSLSHSNFGQRTQALLQPALATTHTASRLSTISTSYYPHVLPAVNVGVAIDGTAPLRGDGQAMKHTKDCGGSNDTIAPPDAKDASSLDQYRNLAYGGVDMITPALAESGRRPPNGGRVRIKSTYYTPGSYPRTSAARPAPKDREQHDGLYPDGLQRSDSHRGREEQALISVLGLNYSVPPSSHPTLFPENSTSTIGETKKVTFTGTRSQKKPVPKAIINDDKMSTNSAAHGSLMTVGLAASKAPASLVSIHPSEASRETREPQSQERASVMGSGQPKTIMKKRVEDKPPRVPSPPLLPSLAQMGLAHTTPEAYTDYHSPTYSIYRLYDGDRKSRGT